MAAEGKIDPMHQFTVEPLVPLHIGRYDISFTNSSLWLVIALVHDLRLHGDGHEARAGARPLASGGRGPDRLRRRHGQGEHRARGQEVSCPTSSRCSASSWSRTCSGCCRWRSFPACTRSRPPAISASPACCAILSFSIVLIVGFWRHGLHFFSLFIPHGTPKVMIPLIFLIEFISFMVRPFSLGLRLFVAMIAGHILMEVFGNFIVSGFNGGADGLGRRHPELPVHRRSSTRSSCWSARSRPTCSRC